MNLSLRRLKRLLPDAEYRVVTRVLDAKSLPANEIERLRRLVRGYRDKYVDRAHRQSREARHKAKPRSTRGSQSNENTMRQADVMAWVLDRLDDLEATAAGKARAAGVARGAARDARPAGPSRDAVRAAIAQDHVSTFGDLWAEFPETPVANLRKLLWSLVEAGEVDLATGGGIELATEEEVAFVEEVHSIGGIAVKKRQERLGIARSHEDHLSRTKVVRIRAHKRAAGARKQAKRDRRGGGGRRPS